MRILGASEIVHDCVKKTAFLLSSAEKKIGKSKTEEIQKECLERKRGGKGAKRGMDATSINENGTHYSNTREGEL
jgi:hypothetical protein